MTIERLTDEGLETLISELELCGIYGRQVKALAELQQRRAADKNCFMYGIADPDGNAYLDEFCVSSDRGLMEDEASALNDSSDKNGYRVVALYTALPLTDSERAGLENYRSAQQVVPDDGRDQFEEWFKFHHGDEHSIVTLHRANGGLNYRDPHVDLAWIAWKDSRAGMQPASDMAAQLESARLHIAELEAAPPAPVGEDETPVPLMPDFPGRTLTQRECYRIGVEAGKALNDGTDCRNSVRREHADWSQSTFGSVGPVGPLKHLSKEALEAAAEPNDLSEWADMQFLLWDAQRRAGITDDQITQAMLEKLEVNKARNWPEPKDGEPRMHIKAAPQQESE